MFNLDPAPQYRLARPPLAQALAQVRFPLIGKLRTFEGITPLQDALTIDFPYMERVVATGVNLSPGGVEVQPEQEISWHLTDDEDRLVIVNSNSITLSLGVQYSGNKDFLDRFGRIIAVAQQSYSLRRCDQLGVRYLDVVPDVGDDQGRWRNWFQDAIVGWAATEIVRGDTLLNASVSQIQMSSPAVGDLSIMPADVQGVVRHGVAPQGSVAPGFPPVQFHDRSFFLDMDLFVPGRQEFEVERIIRQVAVLHSQIDRFFRWSLTDEGEKYFGLEEVEVE